MITIDKFSFLTSQDEYHCILEKILLRASIFHSGVVPTIESSLINNYVEMEKSCLKEDYIMASFYYIKQLEEIVLYGLSLIGLNKISNRLRVLTEDQQTFRLSSFGEAKLNFLGNNTRKNRELILKGQDLELTTLQWTVRLELFKHYYKCNPDYKIDAAIYYMRNKYAHEGVEVNAKHESEFSQFSSNYFQLITKLRQYLKIWRDSLLSPQNLG